MRGTVRKRIAKDGTPRYDVIYRAAGKQVWKTFPTKKAADDYLADSVSAVAAGTYRRVTPTGMSGVLENWQKAIEADVLLGTMKRSTYRSYRSVLTCHLVPAFGGYKSDELTDSAIADWRTKQAAMVAAGTLAPKTFNNIVGVLKVALDWATTGPGKHAIGVNPMPKKRMRAKVERPDLPIVQGAEIARLWAATADQDRVIVGLALFAGLRRGEIFGLPWSDIAWPKGRQRAGLHVSQAFVQRQIVTPKSAAGQRTVQLPARLVALLRAHLATRPAVVGDDGTAYVIRQDDGRPVDPDNWATRVWPQIRTAAKLSAGVGLHALRHTFGSLLLADGAPVKHVSEQMGHANPLITMQVYQKILRATSATATRQLDKHIPSELTAKKLRLVKSSAA